MLDAACQSVVDVDQFYGIELGEFPARITETALWMMDHIMSNRLSLEFGQTFVCIPLEKSPHIVHGDALEAEKCCARAGRCWRSGSGDSCADPCRPSPEGYNPYLSCSIATETRMSRRESTEGAGG